MFLQRLVLSTANVNAGTFPVVALMTGDAITRITHELEICNLNMTNETTDLLLENLNPCAHPECEQMQVDIAECTRWYFDGELRCVCGVFLSLSLSLICT